MSQATPAKSGSDRASYTGRKRRVTRKSVKIIDALAKYVICTGGIGVTLAFVGIVVFIFFGRRSALRRGDTDGASRHALGPTGFRLESSRPASSPPSRWRWALTRTWRRFGCLMAGAS